jgi:hypothetical protein
VDDSDSILGGLGEIGSSAVDLLENLGEAQTDALYAVGDSIAEGADRMVAGVAYGVGADDTAREYRDAAEDWQDTRSGDLDLMQANLEDAGRNVWGDTPPEPEVLARQEPSERQGGFTNEAYVAGRQVSAQTDWLTSGDTIGEAATAGAMEPFADMEPVAGTGVSEETDWMTDAEPAAGAGVSDKREWFTEARPVEEAETLAGKDG